MSVAKWQVRVVRSGSGSGRAGGRCAAVAGQVGGDRRDDAAGRTGDDDDRVLVETHPVRAVGGPGLIEGGKGRSTTPPAGRRLSDFDGARVARVSSMRVRPGSGLAAREVDRLDQGVRAPSCRTWRSRDASPSGCGPRLRHSRGSPQAGRGDEERGGVHRRRIVVECLEPAARRLGDPRATGLRDHPRRRARATSRRARPVGEPAVQRRRQVLSQTPAPDEVVAAWSRRQQTPTDPPSSA